MKRKLVFAVVTPVLAFSFSGCQSGGYRHQSIALDNLEKDLRNDGLITIKRPDVWTENRLHTYRSELENIFKGRVDKFEPRMNAQVQQVQFEKLGAALNFAVSLGGPSQSTHNRQQLAAMTVAAMLQNPGGDPAKIVGVVLNQFLAKKYGFSPGQFVLPDADTNGAAPADGTSNGAGQPGGGTHANSNGQTPTAGAPNIPYITDKVPNLLEKLVDIPEAASIGFLSQFEEENQRLAYVQQNQLIRTGNEPDDGTRMNGYRLYYMRFMVSVTPSGATQLGHSAEILLSPSYDVREAARDWCAQYARSLLREQLQRTVEVAYQLAVDRILRDYICRSEEAGTFADAGGVHTLSAEEVKEEFAPERIEAIKKSLADSNRLTPDALGALRLQIAMSRNAVKQTLRDPADGEVAKREVRALDRAAHGGDLSEEERQLLTDYLREATQPEESNETEGRRLAWVSPVIKNIRQDPARFANPSGADTDSGLGNGNDTAAFELAQEMSRLQLDLRLTRDLAQLAYDEYAREIDYQLRVPNSVAASMKPDPAQGEKSVRVLRAEAAMQTIRNLTKGEENRCGTGLDDELLAKLPDTSADSCVLVKSAIEKALQELAKTVFSSEPRTAAGATASAATSADCSQRLKNMLGLDGNTEVCDSDSELAFDEQLLYFFSPSNWPVYTFAVAPFAEAENIGQAISLAEERALAIEGAATSANSADLKGKLEYARLIREQMQSISVNRTVVGLVRGEQHFGWQFNPPFSPRAQRNWLTGRLEVINETMPSRTYEVFALVAVPGFLRSIDLAVHSDWTDTQRSDGSRIGSAQALEYLRRYRWIEKRVNPTWRQGKGARKLLDCVAPFAGTSDFDIYGDAATADNRFIGELLSEQLSLVEASLPLRKMRKVFLPYGDVSERMTNTRGIDNLTPEIHSVVPRFIASNQKVEVAIAGKNFDTGRIDVLIGGRRATITIANDHTVVAEIEARGFIGDGPVRPRSGGAAGGSNKITDLEALTEVVVITPVGLDAQYVILRQANSTASGAE